MPGFDAQLDSCGVVLRLPCILAAAAALVSCASGPSTDRAYTVAPGDRISVAYGQRQSTQRQTLVLLPDAEAAEFYSRRDTDPLAKLVAADVMQALLDAVATEGLFRHAEQHEVPGAASTIRVDINGQPRIWSKSAAMTTDELVGYHRSMAVILSVFNATDSFHVGSGDNSVLQEGERIRRQNEAARRKAEQRGAGGGGGAPPSADLGVQADVGPQGQVQR